ncbi:ComEA family DNA-binding protein, partial [Salmonella enterica]|uniref:ComEA family DNA-binding protein n=1 Tax=Salmonella enterica TaxID=28901 RepID=UPI0032970B27
ESGLGVRPARSLAARGTALVCLAIAATAILQWRGGRQSRIVLTPAIAAYQIDPNIATRDELMLLPGIGPAVAAQIMDYRASVENF